MSKPSVPKVEAVSLHDRQEVLGLEEGTTDPTKHYRWVSAIPQRVARHKMKGYRLVTMEDGVAPVIPVDNAADGTIRVGDMVLMCCDRAAFEARVQAREAETIRRTGDPKREAKRRAKKRGIQAFTRLKGEDEPGDDE